MAANLTRLSWRCGRIKVAHFGAKHLSKTTYRYATSALANFPQYNETWSNSCHPSKEKLNLHPQYPGYIAQFRRSLHPSRILLESVTVNCPAFAESISEGDVRWEKAAGDVVDEDETVAEIETDKTAIPIPSPSKGVIEEILVEDGTTVTPGTPLFKINTEGGGNVSEAKPVADLPTPDPTPPPQDTPATGVDVPASLPPAPAIPSQPISATPTASVPITPVSSQPSATSSVVGIRTESRVKMNRMRQRISQRLKDSQNTAAMLTTFNEIDMTNIKALRIKYKDDFLKKHGVKLSFMSAFIKASSYALQDQPVVNAVIDDATKEIIYRDFVDISIAVATPRGLVVPVLRNCETMNYKKIEIEMNELAAKARNNELAVEDMDGGTFTISNGGVFGSMFGTPIINPPQSAILGMHAIFDRPVAVEGKIEIRPMMYVALTYDHRLVDGREAVTFLRKIKQTVEDPQVLLLDL